VSDDGSLDGFIVAYTDDEESEYCVVDNTLNIKSIMYKAKVRHSGHLTRRIG
jgi:hypothetical protein